MRRREIDIEQLQRWYEVSEVADDVWAIGEPFHDEEVFSYLVLGTKRDLLFDTGMGVKPIRPEIEKIRDGKKELVVVNSHSHFDHIGGNSEFGLVLYEDGASRRFMYEVKQSAGGVDFVDMKQTFLDHVVERGYDIIPLSRPQQLKYQANYVNLSPNEVLLTVDMDGNKLRTDLEAHGMEVVCADMTAIIQGYGGAHCSISPLVRG